MDGIKVTCKCGYMFEVPVDEAGGNLLCPVCKTVTRIPLEDGTVPDERRSGEDRRNRNEPVGEDRRKDDRRRKMERRKFFVPTGVFSQFPGRDRGTTN